ncbi:RidA family protein [Pseudoxanthomonas sp. UTMC 1351]|uniref:RidA family protein n=1 Tax=Pseudoxanthomonas sp. UTMC 1351 TaxID=2695853 RepID=UPI0034CF7EC8
MRIPSMTGAATLAALLMLAAPHVAEAAGVIRHKIPGSDFPISAAVEVPAGMTTVYLSGAVPRLDADAPKDSADAYGDTEAQTVNVLSSIKKQLESMGLGLDDVIKMQVFLVGDPALDGKMDFAGFMKGYRQFFGTAEQPNLPSRSAFQIAGLANPAYLVEIEVVAVRP